jgi:uncharacterized protein YbjT (DUF2867 family)
MAISLLSAPRTALVAGATGLVGRELLALLSIDARQARAIALVRRVPADMPPRCEALVTDFDKLDAATLPPADDAYCVLGTTIKKAGSKERFREVDFDYCLAFARAARRAGVRRFCIVTALGASAASTVYYSRVKGEIEDALAGLGFEVLHLFRPSLLAGDRAEWRLGERLTLGLLWPFTGLIPARYRPIHARVVAAAMIAAAHDASTGVVVHESDAIARAGRPAAASA